MDRPIVRLLFKILTLGLLVAVLALSVVPPELRPVTEAPHDVEHFAIFVVLGGAAVLGYSLTFRVWIIGGPLYAAFIEIIQLVVPGRHARLSDFVVDAAAVLIGSCCAALLLRSSRISGDVPP